MRLFLNVLDPCSFSLYNLLVSFMTSSQEYWSQLIGRTIINAYYYNIIYCPKLSIINYMLQTQILLCCLTLYWKLYVNVSDTSISYYPYKNCKLRKQLTIQGNLISFQLETLHSLFVLSPIAKTVPSDFNPITLSNPALIATMSFHSLTLH